MHRVQQLRKPQPPQEPVRISPRTERGSRLITGLSVPHPDSREKVQFGLRGEHLPATADCLNHRVLGWEALQRRRTHTEMSHIRRPPRLTLSPMIKIVHLQLPL